MTTVTQKKYFDNFETDRILKELYGEKSDSLENRLNGIVETFKNNFGLNGKAMIFSSPGRIEICGNHTDHNHGKVMAASIFWRSLCRPTTT